MSDLPKAMTVETHEMIVTRLERELEEARQRYYDANRRTEDLTVALAEARQERDAAYAERETTARKFLEDEARIGELEAALRGTECSAKVKHYIEHDPAGSTFEYRDCGRCGSCVARAALQPHGEAAGTDQVR